MLVCRNCWNYARNCECSEPDTVKIDDDLVDIIIGFNRVFIKLNWNIKTSFCCAGHIAFDGAYHNYTFPQVYILFEGDPKYFNEIKSGTEKLKFKNFFFEVLGEEFQKKNRLNISLGTRVYTDTLTLKEKICFLKEKVKLLDFFAWKISKLEKLKNAK